MQYSGLLALLSSVLLINQCVVFESSPRATISYEVFNLIQPVSVINQMMRLIILTEEKIHNMCLQIQRARNFRQKYLTPVYLKSSLLPHLRLCLLSASFVNLMLIIFSLQTWFSIVFFLWALRRYLMIKWEKFREKGLIHYMSPKMQALFLNRSIFDVLCDVWFFPRISLYFKAFFMPLIFKIKPEMAMDQLSILPEPDRKVVLTKGVVYVLPRPLKMLFLPRSFERHNKIQEFFEEEHNDSVAEGKGHKDTSNQQTINELLNASIHSVDNGSSDREEEQVTQNYAQGMNLLPRIKKDLKRESSKVIISSRMLKELKGLPGKMADRWDNLEIYNLKHETKNPSKPFPLIEKGSLESEHSDQEEKSRSQRRNSKEKLSPVSIVLGMIQLRRQKFLNKFSRRSLLFIFIMSVLIFSLKIGFSKRYRMITKSFLMNMSYLAVLTTGSVSMLAIILQTSNVSKKPVEGPKAK